MKRPILNNLTVDNSQPLATLNGIFGENNTPFDLIKKGILYKHLFTLSDMYDFKADAVYHIGGQIKLSVASFREIVNWQTISPHNPPTQREMIIAAESTLWSYGVDNIENNLRALGFTHSIKQYEHTIKELNKRPVDSISLYAAIDGLQRIIESELEEHKFLWLLADEAEKFDNKDPFGLSTHSVLSACLNDAVSASKCLALEQQTACVFHLGRILEFTSQLIGTKLGIQPTYKGNPIPIAEAGWEQILILIDNQVEDFRLKRNLSAVSPFIQANPEEYKSLVFQFRLVKDIWRNPVAHPHIFIGTDPNNPREGWKIYDSIGLFLDKLKPLLP